MSQQIITRLTMSDLSKIVEESLQKIVTESVDMDREIQLAYNEIYEMGKHLSSLALRLDKTPYYQQYQRIKNELVKLNNALINHMKGVRQ